jgi:hypothetical protein
MDYNPNTFMQAVALAQKMKKEGFTPQEITGAIKTKFKSVDPKKAMAYKKEVKGMKETRDLIRDDFLAILNEANNLKSLREQKLNEVILGEEITADWVRRHPEEAASLSEKEKEDRAYKENWLAQFDKNYDDIEEEEDDFEPYGDYDEQMLFEDLQEVGGASASEAEEIVEAIYDKQAGNGFGGEVGVPWMDTIIQKLIDDEEEDGSQISQWYN